ncbi:MAG TPA: hypothetical protein VKZ63_20560 [Kofleriaceae bacterium]|nr:hypothetical protein [Kofleriaceae bacterium]
MAARTVALVGLAALACGRGASGGGASGGAGGAGAAPSGAAAGAPSGTGAPGARIEWGTCAAQPGLAARRGTPTVSAVRAASVGSALVSARQVEEQLVRRAQVASRCYGRLLERSPGLDGTVHLHFELDSAGRPVHARPSGVASPLHACAMALVRGARFQPASGKGVARLMVSIRFSEAGAARSERAEGEAPGCTGRAAGAVLGARQSRLAACVAEELERNPTAGGRLLLDVDVAAGAIATARARGAGSRELRLCVARAVGAVRVGTSLGAGRHLCSALLVQPEAVSLPAPRELTVEIEEGAVRVDGTAVARTADLLAGDAGALARYLSAARRADPDADLVALRVRPRVAMRAAREVMKLAGQAGFAVALEVEEGGTWRPLRPHRRPPWSDCPTAAVRVHVAADRHEVWIGEAMTAAPTLDDLRAALRGARESPAGRGRSDALVTAEPDARYQAATAALAAVLEAGYFDAELTTAD